MKTKPESAGQLIETAVSNAKPKPKDVSPDTGSGLDNVVMVHPDGKTEVTVTRMTVEQFKRKGYTVKSA